MERLKVLTLKIVALYLEIIEENRYISHISGKITNNNTNNTRGGKRKNITLPSISNQDFSRVGGIRTTFYFANGN